MTGRYAVIWSTTALDQIDDIEAYIAGDSPQATRRLRLELVDAGDSLERNPRRGVRVHGKVRKLLTTAPYVIQYALDGPTVVIISVKDGRRRRS